MSEGDAVRTPGVSVGSRRPESVPHSKGATRRVELSERTRCRATSRSTQAAEAMLGCIRRRAEGRNTAFAHRQGEMR